MWSKLISKLAIHLIRSTKLTGDDKTAVVAALLDNLHAIPIRSIISYDEHGTLLINNKALAPEQLIAFKNSCDVLKNSYALNIIHEQVMYKAIEMGVHKGLNPDMILFAKAALWFGQEQKTLIDSI